MKTLVILSFDVEKVYFLDHLPQSSREFEAETGTSCGDWGGGALWLVHGKSLVVYLRNHI